MVYECWFTLLILIYFKADVKPIFPFFVICLHLDRCCYQGDCGRSYNHFFLQMLLPFCVCDGKTTHITCYDLIFTTMAVSILEYVGELARNFEERYKAPSPIHDHLNISDHNVTIDNFSILGREDQNLFKNHKRSPIHKSE